VIDGVLLAAFGATGHVTEMNVTLAAAAALVVDRLRGGGTRCGLALIGLRHLVSSYLLDLPDPRSALLTGTFGITDASSG
jgi:hypothetical protein